MTTPNMLDVVQRVALDYPGAWALTHDGDGRRDASGRSTTDSRWGGRNGRPTTREATTFINIVSRVLYDMDPRFERNRMAARGAISQHTVHDRHTGEVYDVISRDASRRPAADSSRDGLLVAAPSWNLVPTHGGTWDMPPPLPFAPNAPSLPPETDEDAPEGPARPPEGGSPLGDYEALERLTTTLGNRLTKLENWVKGF